ncbi:MAG: 2-oxoacid:acceptor oxidoreductase family protein, partial [Victivallaceae bacterium]|nr:2-oxoacid:acceptor oxidoreductase family protein [Victivallaceae bacterium]
IAMTQTGLDKFGHVLGDNGILVYDKSTMAEPKVKPTQKVYGLDALAIANSVGNSKCANSVILGALSVILEKEGMDESEMKMFDAAYESAITENFAKKPAVLKQNFDAYAAGKKVFK